MRTTETRYVALENGRILTAQGRVEPGTLLIEGGRIAAHLAPDEAVPDEAVRRDAAGLTLVPGFVDAHVHGGNGWPSTPFNGSGGGSNPYLIVAFNGSNLNWNGTNFPTSSCLNGTCSGGSLDLDPIPYTQPAAYYDATGNMVGPQANPFTLVVTNLYADPAHAGQWATRTVAGTQHWGTFSNAVNVLGTTVYQYVQQY